MHSANCKQNIKQISTWELCGNYSVLYVLKIIYNNAIWYPITKNKIIPNDTRSHYRIHEHTHTCQVATENVNSGADM